MPGQRTNLSGKRYRFFAVFTVLLMILMLTPIREVRASEEEKLYSVDEIMLLAAAMQLENGMNSDLCVLLTSTVILNRVRSKNYPNTIKGVLFDKGQYASHTVENLYTVKVTDRVLSLALRLISHRPMDAEIVFQSQYKDLGHVKYIVDKEYFATE